MQSNLSDLSIPFIDTSKVLYTQTAMNFTYTATQDCILAGTQETSGSAASEILLNNVRVAGNYSAEGDLTTSVFLPLKKGQKVKYTSNKFNSSYPLRIFALLK